MTETIDQYEVLNHLPTGVSTIGWTLQFGLAGDYPLEANKIFNSLAYAQNIADGLDDIKTHAGDILKIINDTNEKGVYYVLSTGDGVDTSGTLLKLASNDDVENLEILIQETVDNMSGDQIPITTDTCADNIKAYIDSKANFQVIYKWAESTPDTPVYDKSIGVIPEGWSIDSKVAQEVSTMIYDTSGENTIINWGTENDPVVIQLGETSSLLYLFACNITTNDSVYYTYSTPYLYSTEENITNYIDSKTTYSNTNQYIKYDDGRMECWGITSSKQVVFPEEFIEIPVILLTNKCLDNSPTEVIISQYYNPTISGFYIKTTNIFAENKDVEVSWNVRGKWK